jgi:hypothetical protein
MTQDSNKLTMGIAAIVELFALAILLVSGYDLMRIVFAAGRIDVARAGLAAATIGVGAIFVGSMLRTTALSLLAKGRAPATSTARWLFGAAALSVVGPFAFLLGTVHIISTIFGVGPPALLVWAFCLSAVAYGGCKFLVVPPAVARAVQRRDELKP